MKHYHWIIAIFILAAGTSLRLYHLFFMDAVGEPFRLGGLFLLFAQEISKSGFQLPVSIPYYSQGGIPFAYPPLAFYVEALLLRVFPGQNILLVNLLPPLVSVLTLALFAWWLTQFFKNRPWHILSALFAYSFLPNAFANQVEAGGLAEAFGSLALLGLFAASDGYRKTPGWKFALLTGLTLGLCVLASPGSAVAAAMLGGLFLFLCTLRNFVVKVFPSPLLAAITALLVSAPYWLTVMLNHGRGIFIIPVLAQYDRDAKKPYLQALLDSLTAFNLTEDGWAFLWNTVIFLGLLWLCLRGRFALPLAFFALFSIPRENTWLVALPASLLFACGLVDFITRVVANPLTAENPESAGKKQSEDGQKNLRDLGALSDKDGQSFPFIRGWKSKVLVGILILIGARAIQQSFDLRQALIADKQWKISAEQVQLLQKNRNIIPKNASVLVLGNDALLEWSPVLLEREVVNTKFGLEWQPNELQRVYNLNQELSAAANWGEIAHIVEKYGLPRPIYIIAAEKKALTALSRDNAELFTLQLETHALQIGVLGKP